jgi:hypothetical protein
MVARIEFSLVMIATNSRYVRECFFEVTDHACFANDALTQLFYLLINFAIVN